ncbi:T9SS type A sorting domain-containing protein [Flavobacterium sp. SUN052]|uniref:T9SS type A sorting domain-containing protein n=1 Tax=Flavobacterium sp. SUN052 TaxID=3002441 RepID=UPI00237DDB46|nr:T9SS type A sorting domain-containing protein [Flavobacterium sp. SUN052]MEC4004101.1 T9SS type A sorting domain-containing protein [Flavobacterium sp. SUN052]
MRKFYTNSFLLLIFGLFSFSSFGQINAVDNTFAVVYDANQVTAGNFLLNDTLNGVQATTTNVTVSLVSTTNSGISISGTNIVVAGGTPQGTYTLTYQICDVANPNTCDTAVVTVNTQLLANPDSINSSVCSQYTIGNVLGSGTDLNYVDTLNGVPVVLTPYYTQPGNVLHPATATLTYFQNYPDIIINYNGDVLIIPSGQINPGYYTLTYQLCEIAHPNNCSVGYVTLNLYPGQIYANYDDFTNTPIDNTTGGNTISVLSNDFSECSGGINLSNSNVFSISIPNGLTLYPDGVINVAIGTAPGTYLVNYMVCVNGGLCSQATATVLVTGVSSLVANYDDFSTNYPNSTTASVLANDTLNGNLITNSSSVILTALNNPAGFTLNTDGTITIASTVPEGTYTVPYKICNPSSMSDCYVNYAYVVVFKNRILGKIKFDANSNGCDVNDAYLNNIRVKNVNGTATYSNYTNYNGNSQYYLIGDVGTNTVTVTNLPSYFTVSPANQVFNFTTPGTTTASDFCVSINANVDDLEVVAIPRFNVVPGLPAFYDIWYKNNGSTTLSGQVSFQFNNSKMSFLSSSPSPNTIGTSSLTYTFSSLAPFESRLISNVKFQVATPPTINSGDVATITGTITPVAADATPTNNTSVLNQTVVNSQDPNDIVVHEGTTITLAKAQQDYLHYTIRFQNVGTSNAINIKVVNDLDAKLDWSTFELISTSHNCRIKNKNGHNEFLFEGINLPGTTNEPLSHGYISFKVKPIASIAVGNVIPSVANIYFDYNAAIATNAVSTTVVANLANENFALNDLKYFPNPVKNSLSISNSSLIDKIEISTIIGQNIFSKTVNNLQTEIDLSDLSNGVYFLKINSEGQEKTIKIIKE